MKTVVFEIIRGRRVASTSFLAVKSGQTVDLAGVTSFRLVGFYCCRHSAQAAITNFYRRIAHEGILTPRDLDHEAGVCHITFTGIESDTSDEITPNDLRPVPQGATALNVVMAMALPRIDLAATKPTTPGRSTAN